MSLPGPTAGRPSISTTSMWRGSKVFPESPTALPGEPPTVPVHDVARLRENEEIRRAERTVVRRRTAHLCAHPEVPLEQGRERAEGGGFVDRRTSRGGGMSNPRRGVTRRLGSERNLWESISWIAASSGRSVPWMLAHPITASAPVRRKYSAIPRNRREITLPSRYSSATQLRPSSSRRSPDRSHVRQVELRFGVEAERRYPVEGKETVRPHEAIAIGVDHEEVVAVAVVRVLVQAAGQGGRQPELKFQVEDLEAEPLGLDPFESGLMQGGAPGLCPGAGTNFPTIDGWRVSLGGAASAVSTNGCMAFPPCEPRAFHPAPVRCWISGEYRQGMKPVLRRDKNRALRFSRTLTFS